MTSRISLVEQKKLQWAKEREEMARLNGHWEPPKHQQIRTNIRTYPSITRLSSREANGASKNKPLRAVGHYGSTASLRTLGGFVDHHHSACTTTSLQTLDFSTGSLVNLLDGTDFPVSTKRRSPSLPPIYTKDNQHSSHPQESVDELGVEGSRYNNLPRPQKHHYRQAERSVDGEHGVVQHPYEEREGETSGYASDSAEPPVPSGLPDGKRVDSEMSERTWQNPYCETPDTSLPPSRRLSITRLGELNRPRWGSVWGQENGKADPPPPSWLERGLSRLDNTSQVLVINHDSASSPDSSTTGSTGSDSKTYLRGQNIPMDAQVLQEREARRQRAVELQNAIKQQLEEKERRRKAEKERRLREEREEEERIKRERDREKERFEEEQRRMREKETLKLKKEEAMREILASAERKAREEKRQRRRREEPQMKQETPRREQEILGREQGIPRREQEIPRREQEIPRREQEIPRREEEIPRREEEIPRREEEIPRREQEIPRREQEVTRREQETPREPKPESNCWVSPKNSYRLPECASQLIPVEPIGEKSVADLPGETFTETCVKLSCKHSQPKAEAAGEKTPIRDFCRNELREENTLRLPVGKEVAIVLSGRLEDPEFLNRANLQLVNLVVTPSPRKNDKCSNNVNNNLNAFVKSFANAGFCRRSPRSPISPRLVENRILTPSKYRNSVGFAQGRDFGTQTDGECELQDLGSKDGCTKDRKDVVNNNRRDVEKSTNTGPSEEPAMKPLVRSKSQPRTTLESRPRWNANRSP